MPGAEHLNRARAFLKKGEEYLASAEANFDARRYTPAAGDASHAGINAKDAIVMALSGATSKGKNHAAAAKELRAALATRDAAASAERSLRELIAAKTDVEYGTDLVTAAKAEPLVRRARFLIELAVAVIRLGR
jgi:HEPN domain-containing protein